MSGRDQPCAQRIDGELAAAEQRFAGIWHQVDDTDALANDERCSCLYEELEPLSIQANTVLTVMFSWGGPSDWLEVILGDGHGADRVERIAYHYAEWFDHAERDISATECPALWRAAEYYVEAVGDLPGRAW
jgi:hypothetical protein